VYVADGDSGLQIIDISDPLHPARAGSCDTPGYAYDIAVAGDHAYVADGASAIYVFAISIPPSPVLVGMYDMLDCAVGVAISGDYACVADTVMGLQVLDLTMYSWPEFEAGYGTPGRASKVLSRVMSGRCPNCGPASSLAVMHVES
jgi:hypothetical protein